MERVKDPSSDEVWRSKDGELRMSFPARGIIVSRFVGDLSGEFAPILVEAMYKTAQSAGRLTVFADFEKAHNYHTSTRLKLTQAVISLRGKTERLHFLVSSRVVALGVQTANLVLGNLVLHGDRPAFEKALGLALSTARREQPVVAG